MSVLSDTLRGMGGAKIGFMLIATLAMIGFFIMIALRLSTGNMVPLYTNLSLEDSSKIVAELEKTNTPYELSSGGSIISVPSERALRLRMSMAEEGLPGSGSIVGYEIFDRSESFGSSSFVMNVNMMRALEGELARTIASLSGVDSARVNLVMPGHELFTRDKQKPSASVTVKMRGGHSLEHAEVIAIAHLVAAAVPGLDSSRVTIVDSQGHLLARGDGNEGTDAAADTALEYRVAYENRTKQTVEDLLEKVVGAGKVRAQVAADINFDRTVTNQEKYDPDGQVARSTQTSSETDKSQDKAAKEGSASVAGNVPGGAAGGDGGASSNHAVEHTDETTNYEISKTVLNHVQEGGTINKMSVAVLVDGNYTADADGKQTYAPRTEDELKQLKTLVSTAIGYDEKRGDKLEVVNMRFTQEDTKVAEESFFERFKLEMQSIIQTLIIAVVAILAILLVLRPAVMQMFKDSGSPSERVAGELAAIQAPAGGGGAAPARLPGGGGGGGEPEVMIDVANIKGGLKSSSIKKMNEIVSQYPEETMGVLRQWILKQS